MANINRHILIDISKSIMLLSKSNGILILSGLLYTDREDILELYSGIGFNLVDEKRMGEWIALVFINQK